MAKSTISMAGDPINWSPGTAIGIGTTYGPLTYPNTVTYPTTTVTLPNTPYMGWIVDLKSKIKSHWIDKELCCDELTEEEAEYLECKLVEEILVRKDSLLQFNEEMFPSEVNNLAGIMALGIDRLCDTLGRSRLNTTFNQTSMVHGCKREFVKLFKAIEHAEEANEFISPIANKAIGESYRKNYYNQTQWQTYPNVLPPQTIGTTFTAGPASYPLPASSGISPTGITPVHTKMISNVMRVLK